MKWHECLKANFGTPISVKDKNEIDAWEELMRPVTNSNAEIKNAIQMAADNGYKPEKYHVTVTDLKKWVKIYRKSRIAITGQGNQDDKRIMQRFKHSWIKRLSEGAAMSELEDAVYQQPLSSTLLHDELLRDVLQSR